MEGWKGRPRPALDWRLKDEERSLPRGPTCLPRGVTMRSVILSGNAWIIPLTFALRLSIPRFPKMTAAMVPMPVVAAALRIMPKGPMHPRPYCRWPLGWPAPAAKWA